jgi:hypothetical protein
MGQARPGAIPGRDVSLLSLSAPRLQAYLKQLPPRHLLGLSSLLGLPSTSGLLPTPFFTFPTVQAQTLSQHFHH